MTWCSQVNLLHIFRTPFYKNTNGEEHQWRAASALLSQILGSHEKFGHIFACLLVTSHNLL